MQSALRRAVTVKLKVALYFSSFLLLAAFLAGCGEHNTTGYNPAPTVSPTMIETFLYGAWIGGQALYWLFLRDQTESLGEEYWRMFLLISRNRTTENITR
jgi:hypothetical protein